LKGPRSRKRRDRFPKRVPLLKPWLVKPEEFLKNLKPVWESGRLSLGANTDKLEGLARKLLGVKEAIAVSSCTSGLILLQKALGIKKKVVVPDYTFPATSHSVLWAGGEPLFCDVDLGDYTLSPEALSRIEDPDVEAVIAVNIFGLPPKVGELERVCRKKGWKLIYDSAQGLGGEYLGKMVGGNGIAEVFSLSPSKLITAAEGGLVTTNDRNLGDRMRELRNYGKGRQEDIGSLGLSARLSELCATLAYLNLRHLKALRSERKKLVDRYKKALGDLPGVLFQETDRIRSSGHNYFVLRISEESGTSRDRALQELKAAGIECKRYFYPAVHRVSAYRGKYPGNCPNAERLSREAMAIPLYSGMGWQAQEYVISKLRKVIAR